MTLIFDFFSNLRNTDKSKYASPVVEVSPPTPTPTPPTLEPEQTPDLCAEFDANNPFVSDDDDDNWSDHSSLADDIEDSELLKLIDHLDSD